ncbi:MAG: HAD-IC family P-type ATPase, partial [Nitriliruptorales bacterium]|nr:HAD-IC family P-type ATPase [Nitriliruptorales bacterium]
VVLAIILVRQGISTEGVEQAFLAAIALAVAAIPEGLATVTAVGLALGVRRMAERGAIVRRLPAVETLGSATVIATDKTGTLTENRMRWETFAPPGGDFAPLEALDGQRREVAERVAVLCNDGELEPPVGDPTDIALLAASGPERVDALRAAWPRAAVIPFDSERKRETTVHRGPDGILELQIKGAPENVLPRCAGTPRWREEILARNEAAAGRGTRVLALARRVLDTVPSDLDEAAVDLELVGLAGLRDPVRPAAAESVAEARSAGIVLLMATGDHPGTATAIAEEVGLAPAPVRARTGRELRSDGFAADPTQNAVYARVDPDQKLELVRLLQEGGHVVGMTGDGVNDAPALRRADIGIALGRRGSDVAREAADMVITDDDLATIVAAVREGRGIYDNVRKVVDYLVTGNLGEVLVVFIALLSLPALGIPLFPLQLLWINLITDGMPAVALGVDPNDPKLMRRPPRPRDQGLLGWERIRLLLARGFLIAAATLAALLVSRYGFEASWEEARAVMFTTLVAAGLLYAFAVRRGSGGPFSNRWLLLAVLGGFLAQLFIVYFPPAQELFATVPLDLRDWALALAAGAAPSILLWLTFRGEKTRPAQAPG